MHSPEERRILNLSHRKEVGIMVKIYGIDIQDVDELIFGDDERVICSER